MNERVERELQWLEEHVRRVRYQADLLSLELVDSDVVLNPVFLCCHQLEEEVKALREKLISKPATWEEAVERKRKDFVAGVTGKSEEVEEERKEAHEPLSPELERDLESGNQEGRELLPEVPPEPPSSSLADNASH